jgi:hypothetical protein
MNPIETWTTFFGWLTVVNIGIYLITAIALFSMRSFVYRINSKMFKISEADVAKESFRYIGFYKLAITVFCFAPWLALKFMA